MAIKKVNEQVMYIGDTFVKEGLFNGTVYINGLPKTFDKFIENVPTFKNLLVPVEDVAEKLEEIKERDSILYHSNLKLKEYIRGDK